jgi:hypothetical protein
MDRGEVKMLPKVWLENHDLCIRANCFLGFEMPQAKNQELGHSSQGGAAPHQRVI